MLERIKALVRGTISISRLKRDGLVVGENFHAQEGVIIDPGHCWLIEIGDNVTLAPRVHILAHDASTKNGLGVTKINTVRIGSNVFIGADTIVMPGAEIQDNSIIGAKSLVIGKLKDAGLYVGSSCRYICSYEEYMKKQKERMEKLPIYDESYVIGKITYEKKMEMKEALLHSDGGFIV